MFYLAFVNLPKGDKSFILGLCGVMVTTTLGSHLSCNLDASSNPGSGMAHAHHFQSKICLIAYVFN